MSKFKIKVLFGEDACNAYHDGKSVRKSAELGELTSREFSTEAERDAWLLGVYDCLGWQDYVVVKEWETKK